MTDHGKYVARETAISALINAVISVAFFLGVFGFGSEVPVWGVANYAFDFLPQSFAIGFFASFVPSLLTRKAIASGKIAQATSAQVTLESLFLQAIMFGVTSLVLGAGLWAAGLWASGAVAIPVIPAFVLKVVYGAALGALVTFNRLQAMLR